MALDLVLREVILDPECQLGDGVRVIWPHSRDPGCDHVRIAHSDEPNRNEGPDLRARNGADTSDGSVVSFTASSRSFIGPPLNPGARCVHDLRQFQGGARGGV